MVMDVFKVPSIIPQDILLIHDLVYEPVQQATNVEQKSASSDDIDSSSNESESGDEIHEIESELLVKSGDGSSLEPPRPASPSDSNSSCNSDREGPADAELDLFLKDEIEGDENLDQQVNTNGTYFRTKNEIDEAHFPSPDFEEVGTDETLENVGEVLSVVGNTVIVRGNASEVVGRASEKALDSETLLVFEDRKVLGYIYETFGPTYQPLYQVKFSENYPLDLNKVRPSRQVFHVPQRSRFVFLNQINRAKGSDASNLNDEEPGEDELDFSDDEQEAAFKRNRKRKREGSYASSASSSRQPTPTPSQMHDQELAESWLAEHGTYDMDLGISGLSRPAPVPYDDPYADVYEPDSFIVPEPAVETRRSHEPTDDNDSSQRRHGFRSMPRPARGRGRGNGSRNRDRSRSWSGRERGRERGHIISHDSQDFGQLHQKGSYYDEPYDPCNPLSPPPASAAHTAAPFVGPSMHVAGAPLMSPSSFPSSYWSPGHLQHGGIYDSSSYQQVGVQPHINPRFASAFGINLLQQQQAHPQSYGGFGSWAGSDSSPGSWLENWAAHGSQQGTPESGPHFPP